MPGNLYARHERYGRLDRIRYARNTLAWLSAQATRLSTTVAVVFARLQSGSSAAQVAALAGTYPANTVLPAITGTTTSGQTLTTTNGTWTGTATITYTRAWLRDGVVIAAATGTTYVLQAADVGKRISVRVTATNGLGSITATSAQTAIIA